MARTSSSTKSSKKSSKRSTKSSASSKSKNDSLESQIENALNTSDLSKSELTEKLNICINNWVINSAFASAAFVTLLGMSLSGFLSVAYNALERYQSPTQASQDDETLNQVMYLLTIGTWTSIAWLVSFVILAIVFAMKQVSNTAKWVVLIAFLGCTILICTVASWSTYLLNNFTVNSDAVITAKYITGMTAVTSGFLFFFILIIGLSFMLGIH